jgi:1,4-dihydroxy-2-naphthoyl-CoA hydrolase
VSSGGKSAPVWFDGIPLEELNRRGANCANGHLGIELIEAGDDWLRGRMPVDHRTRQPAGVLHGGVSMVLAETLVSWAAAFVVDPAKFHCVGQEINANHIRAAAEGWVYGIARPLHIGRSSQVWEVKISDEAGKLVCVSRVTMAVLATPMRYLGLPPAASTADA